MYAILMHFNCMISELFGSGEYKDINDVSIPEVIVKQYKTFQNVFTQRTFLDHISSSTEDLISVLHLEKNTLIKIRDSNSTISEGVQDYVRRLDYK